MCRCHTHDCCNGCQGGIDRRGFLKGLGTAAAAVGGLSLPGSIAGGGERGKVRVAAVFLANTNFTEIWPYPGFDAEGREAEILAVLGKGCEGVEFVPVTVRNANDIKKAVGLKGEVDGYLVYVVTLDWGLGGAIAQIGGLGKPMMVANEFLGGCGVFLTRYSGLCSRGIPAAGVSSTRLSDLVAVEPGVTAESFARRCEEVYRKRFVSTIEVECANDRVKLTDTDSVTMNCLGGSAAGKLAAYPCLGFMQILNDQGVGIGLRMGQSGGLGGRIVTSRA